MPIPFEEIEKGSQGLISLSNQILDWADKYTDEVMKPGISNAVKKIRRELKKVEHESQRRPAVAVFGQSQVGKSYLVQNLTKPSEDTFLFVKVSGEPDNVNFLTEINPSGGKESTGTVTRFTTKDINNREEFPFKVELFSQLDIAAILVNGFHSDLKDITPSSKSLDQEWVQELFNSYRLHSSTDKTEIEDELHEFISYVTQRFSGNILIQNLVDSGYFSLLLENLATVPFDSRVNILEPLWNNNAFISDLFIKLSDGIKALRFSQLVHVNKEAIVNSETTILDVARVNELFRDTISDNVRVFTKDCDTVLIDRSVFGALTKEVELVIANNFDSDPNRSFIRKCDVLDFPGSKSRDKIPESVFNSNPDNQKLQLFIRGKVAYLFDYYSENQGVSSLIYCMDNTPPEEKGAPARLKTWIDKYVGKNPEERKARLDDLKKITSDETNSSQGVSPLMIALTKFNFEIDRVIPGKEEDIAYHNSKWKARLEENFLNFMHLSVDDKWVNQWDGEGNSFSFVFPIRDPLYSQTTFYGFDSNKREEGIRPERESTIKAVGTSFNNSPIVRRLVPDHRAVWEELISPNGSGISHLCKYLAPATLPVITAVRLESVLEKSRRDLKNILKPYMVSGDLQTDLASAEQNSIKTWMALTGVSMRKDGTLSKILSAMVIRDTEIWKLLYQYKFSFNEENDSEEDIDIDFAIESLAAIGVELISGASLLEVLQQLREKVYNDLSDSEILDSVQSSMGINLKNTLTELNSVKTQNFETEFVERIIAYWHQKLLTAAQNDTLVGVLSEAQRDAIVSVINEIVKGRSRFKLGEKLSEFTTPLITGTIDQKDFDLIASCCAGILNKFFFSAGWAFSEEEDKPLDKNRQTVFSDHRAEFSMSEIIEFDGSIKQRPFLNEWVIGVKNLYTENVRYEYNLNEDLNLESNEKLNSLIEHLSSDTFQ